MKIVKFFWWFLVLNPIRCANRVLQSAWVKDASHNIIIHPLMMFLPNSWGQALHDWNAEWAYGPAPVLAQPKYVPYRFAPDKDLTSFSTRDGYFKYRVDCEYLGGGFVEYVDSLAAIDDLIASMAHGAVQEVLVTTCWLTADEFKVRNADFMKAALTPRAYDAWKASKGDS